MRSAVARRLRPVRGFNPGSLAATSVAWMTWSRSLRVMARAWSRTVDLVAVEVTVRTWRVASLDSTAVVDGVTDHAVQNALGLLRRPRAVSLGHSLQEAAQALWVIRMLECETTERRRRGVDVLLPGPGEVSDRPRAEARVWSRDLLQPVLTRLE